MSAGPRSSVGAVAIGKNEGERLRICLHSLAEQVAHVVYVDSGSSDGSVELARSMGAEVVELDPAIPFTAARARNAGVDRLTRVARELKYAQLIDGDCELLEGWIENAVGFLEAKREYDAAAGRLRERFPDASVYNYLCDVEWNTPLGDAAACGGIVMMRVQAFESVGRFMPEIAPRSSNTNAFKATTRMRKPIPAPWHWRQMGAKDPRDNVLPLPSKG